MAGGSAQANAAIPWTARAVEICLGLAVAVPPFVFGARQAYGQLVLAVFVLLAFAFWIAGKIALGPIGIPLRRPEVLLPLAAIALSIVTWISLPPSVIHTMAPGIGKLLPDWAQRSLGAHGDWNTFSLTPGLSRDGTFLFVLYALLFWMTVDTVRHLYSVQRLLRILFVAGVGVAALGLLHYLFWNGKFYWLWEIWWVEPDRQVRAPFTNRNHFAGFLALTVGPGVAVLMQLIRDWKRTDYSPAGTTRRSRRFQNIKVLLTAGGLILILAGIVLSQSRGGLIVGLIVATICILGIISVPSSQPLSQGKPGLVDRSSFSQFPSGRRHRAPSGEGLGTTGRLLLIGLIILASLGLAITFARQDPFQRTVQALGGNQTLDELLNDRLRVWKADLQAVKDFPLLGSGPGSHQYVCPVYLNNPGPFTFTHAENCYVQVLMECGLAGGVLLLVALFLLSRWSWRALQHPGRSRSMAMASLAVAVSLLAALVHATVDFVWYVPAYAATLAVLAGLIRSLAHKNEGAKGKGGEGGIVDVIDSCSRPLAPSPPHPLSWLTALRPIWAGALVLASIAFVLVVGTRFVQAAQTEYAWNAYYRLGPEEGGGANPATLDARVRWLTRACECGSADPDHYLQLGLANLELFLQRRKQAASPAGLLQTRKLLQQGRFAGDREARAWLQNRYGDDFALLQEAQAALDKSLDSCPLLGEAYLHLAKLCFLDNPVRPAPSPLMEHGLLGGAPVGCGPVVNPGFCPSWQIG
jgi:O-antigen ligase